MKVLMIVLNGVSNDNRVLKSAHSCKKLKHTVEIYGMSTEKELQTKPVLHRISNLPVRLFPNPGYFLSGVKVKVDRWKFMIDYFISSMWTYVEKMSPDIVYTHDYNTIKIGKEVVARLRSLGKFVYWVHDLHEYTKGLTALDDQIYELALNHEKECIHHPDRLITISPMLSQTLTQNYNLSQSPDVLINAPEYNKFDRNYEPTVRQVIGLGEEVPLIVYVGGVSQQRGVHTAVDALPHLPEVHLVLVTNNQGDYIERLKSSAESHKCSERLHIIPYVEPDKVSSFVRDATVAIHTMIHFPNAEIALPNKLYEYMHSDVPLLVSDCDSMGRFVRKWKIGEVFEAENPNAFVDAVNCLINQRDLYVKHIQKFSILNQYFSWENQVDFFKKLNQDIEVKYQQFLRANNHLIDSNNSNPTIQEESENHEENDLFNIFYDTSLTNYLFSKYYYCSGKDQITKDDKRLASREFYFASKFISP